eukprot:UN22686
MVTSLSTALGLKQCLLNIWSRMHRLLQRGIFLSTVSNRIIMSQQIRQ